MMTSDQEAVIRDLWENTASSASEIAEKFGTTRNVIVGLAKRRGWNSYNPPSEASFRTFDDRIGALHLRLDAVLRETAPVIAKAQQAMREAGRAKSRR